MKKIRPARTIKSLLLILLFVGLASFPVFAVTPALLQYDINGDGKINVLDLTEMSTHMGEKGTPGWIKEDVDKNGVVSVKDMMLVANHFGESVTTSSGTTSSGATNSGTTSSGAATSGTTSSGTTKSGTTSSGATNSGTTSSGTTNGIARIQKMSICYSGRIAVAACRTYIAQHFDLVDTSINFPTYVQWVKDNAVNPNIKAIGYYDVVFGSSGLQTNWYVHSGGNIVKSSSASSLYVMNPSSGWANYYIQRAKTALNANTMYNGIFLDDLWYDPTYDTTYWSSSPSSWDISMTTWQSSMVTFMGTLKTTLGSDIVMGNIEPPSALGTIGDQTKAIFLEHFVHKLGTSATDNGRTSTVILTAIDYLHGQAAKGNIIAVVSGCNAGTGCEDWAKFCYACFAFAVQDPSKAYFAWNFMQSSPTTNPTWYQWMDDYAVGTPTDTYHSISGNVYERTFTNYYVIANLNNLGTSVTFTFNGVSHTLEGKHALFIPK